MTFGIVTVNCGRPLVLRLWLASIDRLREHVGFCFPAVVVSDAIDETICKVHNVAHITKPNRPVSDKWNAGFMHMRDLEVDYVIILGSDDIMSNDYLDRAIEEMNRGVQMAYTKSIYFYSAMKDYTGQLFRYNDRNGLGVGRCIHRKIMDKVQWKPYKAPANYGMDNKLYKSIVIHLHHRTEILGCFITDVKTDTNMNSIRVWARKIQKPSDPELFLGYLSQKEKDLLDRIKKS